MWHLTILYLDWIVNRQIGARCDMQPSRIITDYRACTRAIPHLCLHLLSYSRFFSNLHLIVIHPWNIVSLLAFRLQFLNKLELGRGGSVPIRRNPFRRNPIRRNANPNPNPNPNLTPSLTLTLRDKCSIFADFGINRFKISKMTLKGHPTSFMYTLCSEKKHPLKFSLISPWIICGFKQKLHCIYTRTDRFWQCKN